MKLVNSGTGITPIARPTPRVALKAMKLLDGFKDGHYVTTRQLGDALGVTAATIRNYTPGCPLEAYCAPSPETSNGMAYSNKKTAEYLRSLK
jgi:hypothetical protein